jgi:hypothetical protein
MLLFTHYLSKNLKKIICFQSHHFGIEIIKYEIISSHK